MEGFGGSGMVGMQRLGRRGSTTPLLMEIGEIFVDCSRLVDAWIIGVL